MSRRSLYILGVVLLGALSARGLHSALGRDVHQTQTSLPLRRPQAGSVPHTSQTIRLAENQGKKQSGDLGSVRDSAEKTRDLVVTLPYLADLALEVTCRPTPDVLRIVTLVPPGIDPHTFKLTPSSRHLFESAPMLMSLGEGFESWAPNRGISKDPTRWLDVARGLPLRSLQGAGKGAQDLHIWHSPKLTAQAADSVARFLSERLKTRKPELVAQIPGCLKKFQESVEATSADVKKKLTSIPTERRVLVTNHDAFGYFADAFDLKVVSLTGASTESQTTPHELRAALAKVRALGVKAVFLEAGSSARRSTEAIAAEARVKIGGELIADGLGEKGSGAETTLGLWRTNAATLEAGLK